MQGTKKASKGRETESESEIEGECRGETGKGRETAENGLEGTLEVDDRTLIRKDGGLREAEDWEVFSPDDSGEGSTNNNSLVNCQEKTGKGDSGKHKREESRSGCKYATEMYFSCEACGRMIPKDIPCNSRFTDLCEDCAKRYWKEKSSRYQKALKKYEFTYEPMLVTLTLRKVEGSMEKRLKKLPKLFKAFRRAVKRKYNTKIEAHVWGIHLPNHIHAIVDMTPLPKDVIKDEWSTITTNEFGAYTFDEDGRDSFYTHTDHIEQDTEYDYLRGVGNAMTYLMNYIKKTSDENFSEYGMNVGAFDGIHFMDSYNILSVLDDDKPGGRCPHCESRGWLIPVPKWAYDAYLKGMKDKPPPDGGGGERRGYDSPG